jgi:hypothetical protein
MYFLPLMDESSLKRYVVYYTITFLWGRGVEPSPVWPLLAYCTSSGRCVCSNRWNAWQGKPKYSEKTCSSTSLFTTNLTWSDPGRRGGMPVTKRLSYGTIQQLPYWTVICKSRKNAVPYLETLKKTKLSGLSPRANYTDRATAAFRRSWCQRLWIEGVAWSARQIPTAVFSVF